MALNDIKKKILAEAQNRAKKILSAAEAESARRLSVAQKQLNTARKKADAELEKERAQAVRQRRQLLQMEIAQKSLGQKRAKLEQVLALAVKNLSGRKLKNYYAKVLRTVNFNGAKILAGGDKTMLAEVLQTLGAPDTPILTPQDWLAGRLEIDYGKARLDCSVELNARETAAASEAEIAARLWP
ncbi:vacuolar type H+-transporting ATPase subunit E [Candidatus Termititenax aidoneus]|uniref:Vacuolar type H+-transporting ATPase subunit E n=1 Tax=Termititenax aidoneus TaxID=2218524 RepID=A0A388T8Z8_TERA1|nr:vacuolar type H+-transporting ATPase subunit E [Candidatus Termititenax aidoneus]